MAFRIYVSGISAQYCELDKHGIFIAPRLQHDRMDKPTDVYSAFDFLLDTDEGIYGVRHFRYILSRSSTSLGQFPWFLDRGDDVTPQDQRDRARDAGRNPRLDGNRAIEINGQGIERYSQKDC